MILHCLNFKIDIYAGSDISTVCQEAVALANHLRMGIWFDFNGVHILARVADDPDRVEESWREALAKNYSHASIKRGA